MTVLGIDPGPEETAWVAWGGYRIIGAGKCRNEEILLRIQESQLYGWPVVIEMIASYGMAVGREVFETCVWIGRFVQMTDREGHQLATRMTRGEVKMHLCHSMKAKDTNIRQALIDRFGAPGTKKNQGLTYGLSGDMWAAFALAVTWMDKYGADARGTSPVERTTEILAEPSK